MRLFDEEHGCMEKYLEVKIGIPASFYPTFLGLSLAEDFELGTRYDVPLLITWKALKSYFFSTDISVLFLWPTTAVWSKTVFLLLMIHCLCFVFGPFLFCYSVLSVLSSCAKIILLEKRELMDLFQLSSCCHVGISVMCPFLAVSWAGLRFVIVEFPCYTHLLYCYSKTATIKKIKNWFSRPIIA